MSARARAATARLLCALAALALALLVAAALRPAFPVPLGATWGGGALAASLALCVPGTGRARTAALALVLGHLGFGAWLGAATLGLAGS